MLETGIILLEIIFNESDLNLLFDWFWFEQDDNPINKIIIESNNIIKENFCFKCYIIADY